ncbi:GNAT family N-acetyltransferase [Paenibacillus pini]|nr:GNAT family N-acetyltransferase [Paenibacillus pini]
MTIEQAQMICGWQYEEPYHIYDWMPWEQMLALEIEFGDSKLRQEQYVSVLHTKEGLAGFAQLFPMTGAMRLGFGMRPDLCGHGWGKEFIQAIVSVARQRDPIQPLDLEVLVWNERAIRAYQKAGFEISDTYMLRTPEGEQPFYCMVYQDEL